MPNGSLVYFDKSAEVRSGDIVAVTVNGDDATMKRIFFAGDTIVLPPREQQPLPPRPLDRRERPRCAPGEDPRQGRVALPGERRAAVKGFVAETRRGARRLSVRFAGGAARSSPAARGLFRPPLDRAPGNPYNSAIDSGVARRPVSPKPTRRLRVARIPGGPASLGEDCAASNRGPGKQVTSETNRFVGCCALVVIFFLPFPEKRFGIIYGCCLTTICLKEHF